MEFQKFNSLENTSNHRLITAVGTNGLEAGLWLVTEKIDGANFCFYFDGEEVQIASRNQFVDGTFFGCAEVVDRTIPALKALYEALNLGNGDLLQVYGELHGPSILGRVNYGAKGFRAFDVRINSVAINKLQSLALAGDSGFLTVPVLGVADFDMAIKWECKFTSLLTPEGVEDNAAEGVVIEPVFPAHFPTGSRVYFKLKSPDFNEGKGAAKVREEVVVPQEVQDVFEEVQPLLTESRVYSVISKMGQVSNADFAKLLKATVQDAVEELERATGRTIGRELGASTGLLHKTLSKACTGVVRAVFIQSL